MKPKLYYALYCPGARACILTAKLIGLDLELEYVDLAKKEHLSETFLKLNPMHTIPVLYDDGEAIWDSHAIMSYIVSKYAKDDSLYPKDLLKRARVDQRMHYENGVLFPAFKDFVNRIKYGGETEYNPKSIEAVHNAYEFLEKFLEGDYVVGNTMTIADISIHTVAIVLKKIVPIESERYPKITAWLQRMKFLPDNEKINEKGSEELYSIITSALAVNKAKVA